MIKILLLLAEIVTAFITVALADTHPLRLLNYLPESIYKYPHKC